MPSNTPVVGVVEDDAAVRNALRFSLEVEGLAVRAYDGGESLLGAPDVGACDYLVVGYRMPAIAGLGLGDRLRQRASAVPVIMITGRANKSLRERAGKLGIGGVIEKPLPNGALFGAIQAAIAYKRPS